MDLQYLIFSEKFYLWLASNYLKKFAPSNWKINHFDQNIYIEFNKINNYKSSLKNFLSQIISFGRVLDNEIPIYGKIILGFLLYLRKPKLNYKKSFFKKSPYENEFQIPSNYQAFLKDIISICIPKFYTENLDKKISKILQNNNFKKNFGKIYSFRTDDDLINLKQH